MTTSVVPINPNTNDVRHNTTIAGNNCANDAGKNWV